jgi:hypothetical protein
VKRQSSMTYDRRVSLLLRRSVYWVAVDGNREDKSVGHLDPFGALGCTGIQVVGCVVSARKGKITEEHQDYMTSTSRSLVSSSEVNAVLVT